MTKLIVEQEKPPINISFNYKTVSALSADVLFFCRIGGTWVNDIKGTNPVS